MTIRPAPKPKRPAKKPRAWNSSLAVAEAKLRPKKSSVASAKKGTSLARGKPIRKRRRSKADTERVYGSKAFRDYLHAHPCLWCGRAGVEQAHLRGNGGTGKKKDWTTTGPMCGRKTSGDGSLYYPGCHARWDRTCAENRWFTDAQRTSLLLRLAAFHAAWQSHPTNQE